MDLLSWLRNNIITDGNDQDDSDDDEEQEFEVQDESDEEQNGDEDEYGEDMDHTGGAEGNADDLTQEQITADIHRASHSMRSGSKYAPKHLPDMIMQRELNMKYPFSAQDRVRISQQPQYLPTNAITRFQYDHQVFCGQYSQDGSVYMSACQDRHVRLYDTETWKLTKDIAARDIGWSIIDTDYSPNGQWLIYSSWSDYVHLCNIHGEFELHDALDFVPGGQRFCLFSIKFSPDSNEILGGSSDRRLYIYNIERKERTLKIEAHEDDINTVCFLDNSGNIIVSGSDDHLVKVWDRRMLGSEKPSFGTGCVGVLPGHIHGITHVSPKGDGRYVISNGKDQCLKLWDVRTMVAPKQYKDNTKNNRRAQWDYRMGPLGLALNSGGGSGCNKNDRSVMTYSGHRVLQTLIRAYFSPAYTTGQKYIYTGSYDGQAYIYDVITGACVKRLKNHRAIIRDLSWHPYDTTLVTTSWDGAVCQWTVEEQEGEKFVPPRRRMWSDF